MTIQSLLCHIIKEATQLSALAPELEALGVPIYGILHEEKGAEGFKPYLKGELLFDEKVMLL